MISSGTFGVHFVLRSNKPQQGKLPVYANITVNGTRCELVLKEYLSPADWNSGKGNAHPKNKTLKQFNSYLEEVRGKLARHYRELQMKGERLTASAVKDAYGGIIKEKKVDHSLLWVVSQHNTMIEPEPEVIGEICGIRKNLSFHLARHTFATTVTLMNGVPIETISKMLGHTKLSTTMIYARATNSKIGMDMSLLKSKLDDAGNK